MASAIVQFCAHPKTKLLNSITVIGSVFLLWGLRMPGGDIPFLLAGVILFLFVLILVFLQLLVQLILVLKKRSTFTQSLEGWRAWVLALIAVLVIVFSAIYSLPFKLAFTVSRPSLQKSCEATKTGHSPTGRFWVGVFPFSHVSSIEGGTEFRFDKEEFPWGRTGLYFSENRQKIGESSMTIHTALGDGWYIWEYTGW